MQPRVGGEIETLTELVTDDAALAPLAIAFGELATGYRRSCALFAALGTGLFTALARDGTTSAEAADATGIPSASARLLLDAMAALRLVERNSGQYRLRDDLHPILGAGAAWVTEELLLHRRENAVWLRASSILLGHEQAPTAYRRELLDSRVAAFPGVQAMNRALAHDIVERLGAVVAGAQKVLDLGGGDGCMCDLVLARNPAVNVRVLDLASGFALCARHADHLRAGRLQLEVGDARTAALPAEYDLVIVNELLELFPREEKLQILRRAVAALAPGGHIVVIKFTLSGDGVLPASAALFSVRMRLKTDAGYLETDDEVISMLAGCGCEHARVEDIKGFKSIVRAVRPDSSPETVRCGSRPESPRTPRENETVTSGVQPSDQQLSLWHELVSVATSFRPAAVLFAAAELDIFSRIRPQGSSAEELAASLAISEVDVRVLLNALAAIGIVQKDGDRYAMHTDIHSLLAKGPHCIIPEIIQYRRENENWLRLAEGLREPGKHRDSGLDGPHLSEYLTAVEMANSQSADRLIGHLAPLVERSHHLLDLGGGGGTHAIRLLAANPSLKVTLLDRAEVIERCRGRLIGQLDSGRLNLVAGDALDFDLPERFDIIIISDLLHYFSPGDKRKILANAQRALAPAGAIVVSKFTLDSFGTGPLAAALLSLKVHVQRPGAYLETDDEAAELMRGLGLQQIIIEPLDKVKTVVIGRSGE